MECQRDRTNRESPCQSTFGSFLKKDLRAPYWEGRSRNVNWQVERHRATADQGERLFRADFRTYRH